MAMRQDEGYQGRAVGRRRNPVQQAILGRDNDAVSRTQPVGGGYELSQEDIMRLIQEQALQAAQQQGPGVSGFQGAGAVRGDRGSPQSPYDVGKSGKPRYNFSRGDQYAGERPSAGNDYVVPRNGQDNTLLNLLQQAHGQDPNASYGRQQPQPEQDTDVSGMPQGGSWGSNYEWTPSEGGPRVSDIQIGDASRLGGFNTAQWGSGARGSESFKNAFGMIASNIDPRQPGARDAVMALPDFQKFFPNATAVSFDKIDFGDGNPVDVLVNANAATGAGPNWAWQTGGGGATGAGAGAAGGAPSLVGTQLYNQVQSSILGGQQPQDNVLMQLLAQLLTQRGAQNPQAQQLFNQTQQQQSGYSPFPNELNPYI